jgi:hypothetical protein
MPSSAEIVITNQQQNCGKSRLRAPPITETVWSSEASEKSRLLRLFGKMGVGWNYKDWNKYLIPFNEQIMSNINKHQGLSGNENKVPKTKQIVI